MNLKDIPKKILHILLNYGGVLYILATIALLFVVNAYFTGPILFGDRCPLYIAVGILFMVEIFINFFCFHYYAYLNRVDVIFPPNSLPPAKILPNGTIELSGNPDTTKFCFTCRRTVPLRSHHCPLCNYCCLKKDHHCFMTGGCVGYGNQRYFVIFLFWCGFGALYGTWVTGRYMNLYIKPFLPYGFIDYIFPIAFKKWLLLQHCPITDLGYASVFSTGFAGGVASLVFFALQINLILKGQTLYEMQKKYIGSLHPQRMPMGLRMQCVFGPYWYWNFLFPLPFKNRLDDAFLKLLYESHLKEI